jgi:hypothetical protein
MVVWTFSLSLFVLVSGVEDLNDGVEYAAVSYVGEDENQFSSSDSAPNQFSSSDSAPKMVSCANRKNQRETFIDANLMHGVLKHITGGLDRTYVVTEPPVGLSESIFFSCTTGNFCTHFCWL